MMFGYVSPMDHLGRENRQPRYTDAISLKIKWSGEVQIQLKIWNTFDEIDFEKLPERFVLKCTHDSGGLVICKDKNKLDKKEASRKINKSLKTNFYWVGREWPYKNVKPRIIAEKYMTSQNEECLTDYKFFCFEGEPKIVYISKDKAKDPRTDFFDASGNFLPIRMRDKNSDNLK